MMDDEKFHNLFPSAYQQSDSNPEKKECRCCCIGWDSWKTIFIATIATIFALIGMIVTQFAYHGQIQLQYDQLKTDYESNNTYYEAQLTDKATGRQVVKGLESLQSSVRAQTRSLRHELNGIEVPKFGGKLDEVNCMLETVNPHPDSKYCCALLSLNVTSKTDMQKYHYCHHLQLKLRYGIVDEEEEEEYREEDGSDNSQLAARGWPGWGGISSIGNYAISYASSRCTVKHSARQMVFFCCTHPRCYQFRIPHLVRMCKHCVPLCVNCLNSWRYGAYHHVGL